MRIGSIAASHQQIHSKLVGQNKRDNHAGIISPLSISEVLLIIRTSPFVQSATVSRWWGIDDNGN